MKPRSRRLRRRISSLRTLRSWSRNGQNVDYGFRRCHSSSSSRASGSILSTSTEKRMRIPVCLPPTTSALTVLSSSSANVIDIIQGMDPTFNDLGLAERRDPDALPPRNYFESVMNFLYNLLQAMSRGNVLFALKAAMLTGMYASCRSFGLYA